MSASSSACPDFGAAPPPKPAVDVQAAAEPPLVLYGQRSTEQAPSRCPNRVKGARLRGPGGEWLDLNCGRRSCPYCGRLKDFELLQCLLIDARDELASLVVTLTTVDPWSERDAPQLHRAYRLGSSQLWRALRSEFGRAEYFGAIEFTTGLGKRSGGARRMHGHYLVKGMDPAMSEPATVIARDVWQRSTGAWRVEVAPLASKGGIVGYLALHHRKREQLPPAEWRGMTARASKGYWSRPVAEIREQARREQAERRATWRLRCSGFDDDMAAIFGPLVAEHQRQAWASHRPEVVPVREIPGALVEPINVR